MTDKQNITTEPEYKESFLGSVKLGNKNIPCAVLVDKNNKPTRVFIEREIIGLLTGNKKGGLDRYLQPKNLQPYVPEKFLGGVKKSVIKFKLNGRDAHGFIGTDLIDICKMYYDARKEGKLLQSQQHLADISEMIVFAFAKTGVDAVIDEVTGYQDIRVKGALQEILNQYLLDEAKKYQVTFPIELYKQWFRLNNWEWKEKNAQKRPSVIGKWTNKYIYERIAPNILQELERKNPKNEKGYREYKHFQFLTDEVGEPRLREFFGGLIALARATSSWRKYTELVERAYPRIGDQLDLFLEDD